VEQEVIVGGYKHVGRMGLHWGVLSWAIIRVDVMEGGKGLTCALISGIGKVLGWGSTFT